MEHLAAVSRSFRSIDLLCILNPTIINNYDHTNEMLLRQHIFRSQWNFYVYSSIKMALLMGFNIRFSSKQFREVQDSDFMASRKISKINMS